MSWQVGKSFPAVLVDKPYQVRAPHVQDLSPSMAESTPESTATADDAPHAAPGDAVTTFTPQPAIAEPPASSIPPFAQGLLKIRVPVQVTLASQRKSIQEIIDLGPGAIVKFNKTCDEPLEVCVGERAIATGEVIKVGDKFGVRIGARN
jgi:flagellar motor switch protein FliN/FliY